MKSTLQKMLAWVLALALMMGSVALPAFAEEGSPTPPEGTVEIVATPTPEPPKADPTQAPSEAPTAVPTEAPTAVPTAEPTEAPTAAPTAEPTEAPTAVPTAEPTEVPTAVPTAEPTEVPTAEPTPEPTEVPTAEPTPEPTQVPTATPFDLAALCQNPAALRAAAKASSAFAVAVSMEDQTEDAAGQAGVATATSLPADLSASSLTWILLPERGAPALTLANPKGGQTALAFDGKAAAGTYGYELVCAAPDGRMALAEFSLTVLPAAPALVMAPVSRAGLVVDPLDISVGMRVPTSFSMSGDLNGLTVTYQSSNKAVAMVEKDGTVTGMSVGAATLTVTLSDGRSGSATVTVMAAPTSITLNASTRTLSLGSGTAYKPQTYRLIPTTKTPAYITFSSSSTTVATVSSSGTITPKKVGTATITATTHNGVKKSCVVTVVAPPAAVSLSPTSLKVGLGESFTLVSTAYSDTLKTKKILNYRGTWSVTSGVGLVTVSSSGVVSPGPSKTTGTAKVTFTSHNGLKATCTVTICQKPTAFTASLRPMSIGMKQAISCSFGSAASYAMTYASSDKTIATVSSTGTVTALKEGAVTLTAMAFNGVKAIIKDFKIVKAPTSLKLSRTAVTLSLGASGSFSAQTYTLTPTVNTAATYTFSSSSSTTAKVDSKGKITPVKAGTATITVKTHNGLSAKCTVTVAAPPAAAALSSTARNLGLGESFQITAYTYSDTLKTKKLSDCIGQWTSSATSVATVSSSGLVKAVKAGTATITYTTHNPAIKATCKITVTAPPTGVTGKAMSISVGMKQKVSYTVVGGASAKMTYKSLDKTIATVDASGYVTGVTASKTPARIGISTYNGRYTEALVTVKAAPLTLTLNNSNLTLMSKSSANAAQTFQLVPKVNTYANYTYSTSNSGVAKVSTAGLITAVALGTATIRVRTHNGLSTTCAVTVSAPPAAVSMSPTSLSLSIGESATLTGTSYSDTLKTKKITGAIGAWTSSATSVATVSSAGVVKAVKAGSATITYKTPNGLSATCKVTVKLPPTDISLSLKSLSVGMKQPLSYTLSRSDGQPCAYKKLTFTSSNTAYATISSTGVVSALKAGTVTFTVAAGSVKKSLTVIVRASPMTVSVLPTAIRLYPGETQTLYATANTPATFSYYSSNTSVATVSASGVVKAIKAGTATITVKTHNGISGTMKVTVVAP